MKEKSTEGVRIPGGTRAGFRGTRPVAVAAGLAVRSPAGGDVAKYAGDALYTVLIHTLVLVLAPRVRLARAAGVAPAVSWVVELAQLTGIPADLSRHSMVARLVLGSTFNGPDLLWYVVGADLALAVHSRMATAREPR